MARPAPILIAGILAATVTFAAAATEASAQDVLILNNQLHDFGDVVSGVTLDVRNTSDQQTASNASTGNRLSVGSQGVGITVQSVQRMNDSATATTDIIAGGNTASVVNATTQANGNHAAVGAYGASLTIDSDQSVGSTEIVANSSMTGGTARLLSGAAINVAASGNTMALGGTGTSITGAVHQTSDASVRANNLAETQYIPATASFGAQALGNATAMNGETVSSQNIYVGQRSTGDIVTADVSANAGNGWDLTGRSLANANQAVLANQGGSVVARTQQENSSQVASTARVTAYDFGAAIASAQGGGNVASVGNNDQYLELDNNQLNTGGVEVQATFAGTNGYDAYVSAEAVGNSVTGYACAACEAQLGATNVQYNEGNVTASAVTSVYGQNRAVITSASATGNSATFYVSRPPVVP